MAGIDRGLTMSDIQHMTIGEVVDYCIEYNNRQAKAEKEEKRNSRKATQADWDAFLG